MNLAKVEGPFSVNNFVSEYKSAPPPSSTPKTLIPFKQESPI